MNSLKIIHYIRTWTYPDAAVFVVDIYLDGVVLKIYVYHSDFNNVNQCKIIRALYAKNIIEISRKIIEYERDAHKDTMIPLSRLVSNSTLIKVLGDELSKITCFIDRAS